MIVGIDYDCWCRAWLLSSYMIAFVMYDYSHGVWWLASRIISIKLDGWYYIAIDIFIKSRAIRVELNRVEFLEFYSQDQNYWGITNFARQSKSKNPKIRFSLIILPTTCFNPFQVAESLAIPSSILTAKREDVKVKLALNLPSKDIQKQTSVSLRTVQRIHINLKRYDSARAPKAFQ